jgi:PKD repeat protein
VGQLHEFRVNNIAVDSVFSRMVNLSRTLRSFVLIKLLNNTIITMKPTPSKLIAIVLLNFGLLQTALTQGCSADFTYETDQLNLTCTDLSSGDILTRFWDFGDGSNPSIDPNHTYTEPGEYEVCLTIGNFAPFCFDTYCETVTVVEYTCEPSFDYSGDLNNLYSFTNTTTVGNVTSVMWEFGDGNTSTFANPAYTYNEAGTYEVCLTTFDGENVCGFVCQEVDVYPLGVNDVKSRSFSIYPNPSNGSFELTNASASGNLEITLYDLSGRMVVNRSVSDASTMVGLNYDVPAGIYMLDVDAENGAGETFRLIITQ